MRKLFPTEFVFQVFSLLIAFIVVHAIYVAVIRPNADAFIAEERARMEIDSDYVQQRSYYVVVKDYEQEACFVLMFWALAILGYKGVTTYRQQQQLNQIGIPEDRAISAANADSIIQQLRELPKRKQDYLLPRVLAGALDRFVATRNVQNASTTVHDLCESEGGRLDSELAVIRYIAWAIPSVGFIGTVRGIGDALGQAHRAVEGDITGVTQSLGVAFTSTFIAWVISIVLMFFIHQVQLMQERLVLDSERYCDNWLVRRLRG